ncbi:MAG TPA: flavin reductase family protein, partial [Verrucomicrobiales bacterium]|nr:flavin reductase family protein [Verrucomicrobiales bacterium]
MNEERIGPALGKLPSGVYIATSTLDGEEVGMLASFVEQAGFEPPTITAAISAGRRL